MNIIKIGNNIEICRVRYIATYRAVTYIDN